MTEPIEMMKKWRDWLRYVEHQIQCLFEIDDVALASCSVFNKKNLEAIKGNGEIGSRGAGYVESVLRDMHVRACAITIRALTDHSNYSCRSRNRPRSLYWLIKDLIKHREAMFNEATYLTLFNGEQYHAKSRFAKLAKEEGVKIIPESVFSDQLKAVTDSAEKIRVFVNRYIAHFDPAAYRRSEAYKYGQTEVLSEECIHDAMIQLYLCAQWCQNLLHGSGVIVPGYSIAWWNVFKTKLVTEGTGDPSWSSAAEKSYNHPDVSRVMPSPLPPPQPKKPPNP